VSVHPPALLAPMLFSLLSPPFLRGAHQVTSLTVFYFARFKKQLVALIAKGLAQKI